MKLIHISDLHLGRKSVDDNLGATRMHALRTAVDKAVDLGADAIVVAGDVFHSPQTDKAVVRMAARTFDSAIDGDGRRLPVIIIPGNHDPADATELWTEFTGSLVEDSNVLLALQPTLVELADKQLLIEAYPCPSRYGPEAPWVERLSVSELHSNAFRIVLAHGTLQGGPVPKGEMDAFPFTREEAEALDADYVALGHFHGVYPAWAGDEEVERCISYSGTHEPDQFDSDSGWALVVDLKQGRAVKVSRVPVGVTRWHALRIDQAADLDCLEKLQDEIESDDHPWKYKIRIRVGNRTSLTYSESTRLDRADSSLQALGVRIERQGELQLYVNVETLDLGSLPSGALRESLVSLRYQLDATNGEENYNVLRAAIQLGWEQMKEAI